MRHLCRKRRLGMPTDRRISVLRNLAKSLITHEKIVTTLPRAKELRRVVERLITCAKKQDLTGKRKIFRELQDKGLVKKLASDFAVRFADRKGGYTRILKIGRRIGDCAPMSIIELLPKDSQTAKKGTEEKKVAPI